MHIRPYRPTDCREMADLFYNTVHTINAADYSEDQLNVWASAEMNLQAWDRSFRDHYSLVATIEGRLVGFGDIDLAEVYLDRLYVHKDYQGQGIATALCEKLEAAVTGPITVHASITAKTFFEHRGYRVLNEQQVERQGILLTNFVMQKYR
jgi:putative acetyltransferase